MQRVRKLVAENIPIEIDGRGVAIAVLDTGMGMHPDLQGRPLCFRDFIRHRNLIYDDNGHGTHVCGLKNKKEDKASKQLITISFS